MTFISREQIYKKVPKHDNLKLMDIHLSFWQLLYLFCSSIVINTVIVTAGNFEP